MTVIATIVVVIIIIIVITSVSNQMLSVNDIICLFFLFITIRIILLHIKVMNDNEVSVTLYTLYGSTKLYSEEKNSFEFINYEVVIVDGIE